MFNLLTSQKSEGRWLPALVQQLSDVRVKFLETLLSHAKGFWAARWMHQLQHASNFQVRKETNNRLLLPVTSILFPPRKQTLYRKDFHLHNLMPRRCYLATNICRRGWKSDYLIRGCAHFCFGKNWDLSVGKKRVAVEHANTRVCSKQHGRDSGNPPRLLERQFTLMHPLQVCTREMPQNINEKLNSFFCFCK